MSFLGKIQENPLKALWEILSVIGGVLGLMSFADDWVAWQNHLQKIIELYESLSQYPFQLLGIDIGQMWINYFFFGCLSGSAFIRAIGFGEKRGLLNNHGNPKSVRLFFFCIHLLFWPLAFLIALSQVVLGHEDENEIRVKKNYLNWVGTILLLIVIILIFNATI
jgi:hypothetical protein